MDCAAIVIRTFSAGEEKIVSNLVRSVFDEFVAPDYSKEGNNFFYDWIKPENILARQLIEQTLWVATSENNIVGMIEMRDKQKISLLFVEKNFQGKGIAKRLMDTGIAYMKKLYPEINQIQVNSSPYAVAIYEHYGFKSSHDFQITNGIKYLPMEMTI